MVPSQTVLKAHTPDFRYGLLEEEEVNNIKRIIKKAQRTKRVSKKFVICFDATDIRDGACYHATTQRIVGAEEIMSVRDFLSSSAPILSPKLGKHMWQFFLCSIDNKASCFFQFFNTNSFFSFRYQFRVAMLLLLQMQIVPLLRIST